MGGRHFLAGGSALAAICLAATPAEAQNAQRYDIAAQDLAKALKDFAAISGREILAASTMVVRKRSVAVRGVYRPEEALSILLSQAGLRADLVEGAFVIRPLDIADRPAPQDDAGDIVVTGSRIRGAAPVGERVIVIDRKAIDRSGYATTQQILAALPQNFGGGPNDVSVGISIRNNASANTGLGSSVNLRGLGSASTLVLIDGNRPALGGLFGAFSDLSLIPSSAIDRIEVLADGASALYGSDAVAGVINIRLRNAFVGAESRARYGVASGFDEVQGSQLLGARWASGHAVLGYEYYRRSRLAADDRAYATENLRAFGGPDYRSSFSNPGTIVTFDGRQFAIPSGQNGVGLTASDLTPDRANLADGRAGTDLLPQLTRQSLFASVNQGLGADVKLSAQAFFADRASSTRFIPNNFGGVVVPTTNPFYVDPTGAGQPILVNYDFSRDFGPQTTTTHVRAFSVVGGVEASFGDWSATLHGSYGVQTERLRSENITNYYQLALALADTNPATSYNLFGDGSFTNRATIETVKGFVYSRGQYRVWSTALKIDGPLFRLPAGEVKIALGSEYRREHYAYDTTDYEFGPAPVFLPTSGLPIGRSILAGYAELLVPLVAPAQSVPGVTSLDLSLAGRVERYDDFGTTANPKIGLSWKPLNGLTLRATYGTSFRAPSFQDLRQGPGTGQFIPIPLPDPASPSGTTNTLLLFGNRPGIGPEKARTLAAGLELRPAGLSGLHVGVTYFSIAYRDRIANISTDFLTFLTDRQRYGPLINDSPNAALVASLYQDPTFINPYGIPAAAIAAVIDGRTANLANVTENGLDFDLGYAFTRGAGSFDVGVSGSYLFAIRQKITSTAAPVDVVSTIGNAVDLRLRGNASATLQGWSLAAFVNYIDGYRNTAVTPVETVHGWTTIDLQLGYDFRARAGALRGTRIAVSVGNLLDRAPPYVNNRTSFSAIGFDPDNASPVGRMISLQLTRSW